MNWIKTGWGKDFSSKFSPYKNFHIDMSDIVISHRPLLEVSNRVINQISKKYPSPFNLFVSGGVDSQSMLWCWLNSGVPFTAYSAKLLDSQGKVYNEHDYETLVQFAKKHNIKINFLEFDIFDFLENRLMSYAVKYTCTSPQLTAHMSISEMVDNGTNIFSGNFMPGATYNFTILGLYRYSLLSGYSFIPYFLMHDAELIGCLVQYDDNKNIRDPCPYERKLSNLEKAGIPIIPQETKYTGFEKIKDYYDTNNDVTYRDKIQFNHLPSKRPFDIMFRYRLYNKVKYIDKVVYKLPNIQY
jgi:hypothetical protein